jgi:hypothetical protein
MPGAFGTVNSLLAVATPWLSGWSGTFVGHRDGGILLATFRCLVLLVPASAGLQTFSGKNSTCRECLH